MNKFIAGGCLLLSVLTLSCTSGIREKGEIGKTASVEQSAFSQEQVKPLYAQGFKLTYADQYLLTDIQDPQNEESTTFHYAFVKRGAKPTGIPADYTVIELPIRSVICMTSLQLSNFIKLGALDRVVGITSTRHLFNKEMNERLKEGKTAKIGIEGNFDNEVIMSVNPDLILVSPFKRGGYEMLKDVGIPLIPHLGYKETTPLGQAEWINEKLYEAASPEDGFFLDQSIHFNLQAARATLARVYLTQGNIDSAFYYADKVIREGGLELVEKTEIAGDVIGALSQKETIFGLYAKESFYTRTKEDLYDAVSFKSLNPWNGIATVYQQGGGENDYRWAAWFQTISNNLRFVKLTDPYQLSTGNNRPAGQIPGVNLIRLPEMYYIAAECLLRKNDPKAADYFNAVLESRGLVALDDRIPAESLTIEKITQERYKEFVGEGQTFFNMKRLNLDIQAITGEILPAANSIYTVPVPEEEFNYRNEVYDVKQ